MHLRYGYLWVALGSKGLKLILLSIKDNGFYENSYTLGGHGPPRPPLNPRLVHVYLSWNSVHKDWTDIETNARKRLHEVPFAQLKNVERVFLTV